jgi:predicted SnoaL-like aldol condensation-catalyzing enzyme
MRTFQWAGRPARQGAQSSNTSWPICAVKRGHLCAAYIRDSEKERLPLPLSRRYLYFTTQPFRLCVPSTSEMSGGASTHLPSSIETDMSTTTPEQNKALVLEAFDTLFNKRDYAAAERFWSDRYIQHSAHIAPGRDGLFGLIRTLPDTLRYENQLIVAEGDYVIAHGRFSGSGRPAAWIAADVVRFEDGKLAEHWDVLQDEATREQSASGLPMFGDRFPE